MTRGWMLGSVACLLLGLTGAMVAWGKVMVVTTKDGKSFEGEVTEKGQSIIITPRKGEIVKLNRAIVVDMVEALPVADQLRGQMAKLGQNDVAGRIKLARTAVDEKEFDVAHEALDAAIAIDPKNDEARELQRTVSKLRQTTPPVAAKAKAGAGPAAAEPAEEMPPDEAGAAAGTGQGAGGRGGNAKRQRPIRMVTPEEVNKIRQLELQQKEPVQVRLQNGVKQRYLQSAADISPQEFNKMTPQQQGFEILRNGSRKLHPDVIIATDPASLSQFKSTVQRYIVPGCASAACHSDANRKAVDFTLHNPADKDVQMYTNFLLVQGYKPPKPIEGKDYVMLDRVNPEDSLLLLFGLPQESSPLPHPKVKNFRPIFKGRNDAKYKAIVDWATHTLAPIAPDYGIDLTQDAESGATTRPSRRGGSGGDRPANQ